MDIQLIDNTAPAERPDDSGISRTTTTTSAGTSSKLFSRPSIRGELARRKYAKWQPDRLGVPEDNADLSSSDERELLRAGTNTNTLTNESTIQEVHSNNIDGHQSESGQPPEQNAEGAQPQAQPQDFSATTHLSNDHPKIRGLKPGNELDILYENQRGSFFFGIPIYSDRSLLNIDPAPWINADGKRSFVNITNAQVPDPSWEWAWRTWYVDMSGDVDEQGWQYAFSFATSSWHGTHPFWHSFVRRRRWVRLRAKRVSERSRRNRSGLEMAHRLTEDYFTIHSGVKSKRAPESEGASRRASVNLARISAEVEADYEEIRNIPTLLYVLKTAIVDREKLDAVRRFVEDGGNELYYLESKIPEIMVQFIYQTSRWQFLTLITDTIQDLIQKEQEQDSAETKQPTKSTTRKQEYLSRAAETAKRHLIGPEILQGPDQAYNRDSVPEMLDLTPGARGDNLLNRLSSRFSFGPMDNGGDIKGIPRGAQIGHDVHIY